MHTIYICNLHPERAGKLYIAARCFIPEILPETSEIMPENGWLWHVFLNFVHENGVYLPAIIIFQASFSGM